MAQLKPAPDEWRRLALTEMELVFGPSDETVTCSDVVSGSGYAAGGPDIVHFRGHVAGVVHATCEMIGLDAQIPNRLGNYELAICHRDEEDWGVRLIASLAHYTFDERLEPGHTMDSRRRGPRRGDDFGAAVPRLRPICGAQAQGGRAALHRHHRRRTRRLPQRRRPARREGVARGGRLSLHRPAAPVGDRELGAARIAP